MEHIIFESVARRLEAGTYRPAFKAPAPAPATKAEPFPWLGVVLCGLGLAAAFMVQP